MTSIFTHLTGFGNENGTLQPILNLATYGRLKYVTPRFPDLKIYLKTNQS